VMFGKIDLEVLYSIKPIMFSMVLLTCHFSSELLLSIQPFFFLIVLFYKISLTMVGFLKYRT
jgi:hypothetical protein